MATQNSQLVGKIAAILIFSGAVVLIGREFKHYLPNLEIWIQSLGFFAPLSFALIFVLLTPLFVSVDVLCFTAGVLFPIVTGELTIIVATYLAAALIFFLGRYVVREKALVFMTSHQRFRVLDKLTSGNSAFKLMFLLRLTPLPFALFGYALSVTQVKFWPYLAATSGILIYNGTLVYLGYASKHLMKGAPQAVLASHSLQLIGLLVLVAILVYVTKTANKALKQFQLENSH